MFDLTAKELSDEEFVEPEELAEMSSISIADRLASRHGEGSLVLGTGVLTGSFVPASCAGIVRAPGASGGPSRIMPVMGFAGFELKLSGFDFIVVKGVADRPGYLWIRDGVVDLIDAESMRSCDSWCRTDRIRSDQGDSKIQVIAGGPWCDLSHPNSQAVVSYWGGEDKVGLGAKLGRKNLVAIAVRGMGELALAEPERHFEDAVLLMREQIVKLGDNHGLASYAEAAARDDFQGLLHRNVGCYGCPFPCRSYLKAIEDPREMRLVAKEPGYLHYDVPALESAFVAGLGAKDATLALMRCARAGAEPQTVLALASGKSPGITLESIDEVLAGGSGGAPLQTAPTIGNFEQAFPDETTYRQCLGLGLCPRYWAKVGFGIENVASFARDAIGRPAPEWSK